jgi:ribosomal protein S18 acetylase RimI-like enzyme
MKSQAPQQRIQRLNQVTPGQAAVAVQAHPVGGLRGSTQINARASPKAPQPIGGQARSTAQTRSMVPQAASNRSSVVNQRPPGCPGCPAAAKAPRYNVQPPVRLGARSQQIRATIQGTPQVAGSVEISRGGGGRIHILNLNVDQQHRRRGVASKLIDAAVNVARRQGFRAATLEARPSDNGISSQALVAMYRRQGFRSVGKSGRGNPLMERKL